MSTVYDSLTEMIRSRGLEPAKITLTRKAYDELRQDPRVIAHLTIAVTGKMARERKFLGIPIEISDE